MIVSRQNQKIKDIRRLRRCKGDRVLLEGPHLVREARASGIVLEYAIATPEFLASTAGRALVDHQEFEIHEVAPPLLADLCDSDSPRGILAVGNLVRGGIDSLPLVDDGVYVYVDGIQDPGNLGALARTTEAFGGAALALSRTTAHPNHPRALRASAGSLLRLPIAVDVRPDQLAQHLESLSIRWLALVPRGGLAPSATDLTGPLVVAVGAEGPGLTEHVLERSDIRLTIPLVEPVESLNATVPPPW